MAPTLIGIHGVKRAGKDTTADFIHQWGIEHDMSYRKRGFADEMKLALARIFFGEQEWLTMEWAVNWADTFKEHKNAGFEIPYAISSSQPDDWPGAPIFDTHMVRFRDLMRFIGTDVGRQMWGEDFWVDKLIPQPKMINDGFGGYPGRRWDRSFTLPGSDVPARTADLCVISDVRFRNECQRIHELGGITIKIRRKTAEDAVIAEYCAQGRDVHASDLLLDDELFDYIIDNSDSIMENSRQRTFDMLNHYAIGHLLRDASRF